MRKIIFIVMICFGLLTLMLLYRFRQEQKTVYFDASSSHFVSQIRAPSGVKWLDYGVLYLDNAHVSIVFPNGVSYDGHVSSIFFKRDGDQVDDITMTLDEGTLDQVYTRAMDFAELWNLPVGPIQDWHAHPWTTTLPGNVEVMRNDSIPAVSMEIQRSYADNAHASIVLDVTWPQRISP